MYCPNCGEYLSDGIAYCPSCGTRVNGTGGTQYPKRPAHTGSGAWKKILLIVGIVVVLAAAAFAAWYFLLSDGNTATMVQISHDNYYDPDQPLWGNDKYTRKDITKIVFGKKLKNAREGAWDISDAEDGSILAWVKDSTLYIGAKGKVAPNPDASFLFMGFKNVKEIDFADSIDTSNVENMSMMFWGCYSLTDIDVSGFDTSNVTDMSYMFQGCTSLTKLDVSGFDTSNVTNMSCMFGGCTSLTKLDVSGFDTSNVTDMSSMFEDCTSLTKLDVSGFDTSKVTDMRYMFGYCTSLTELDTSNFVIRTDCNTEGMYKGVPRRG